MRQFDWVKVDENTKIRVVGMTLNITHNGIVYPIKMTRKSNVDCQTFNPTLMWACHPFTFGSNVETMSEFYTDVHKTGYQNTNGWEIESNGKTALLTFDLRQNDTDFQFKQMIKALVESFKSVCENPIEIKRASAPIELNSVAYSKNFDDEVFKSIVRKTANFIIEHCYTDSSFVEHINEDELMKKLLTKPCFPQLPKKNDYEMLLETKNLSEYQKHISPLLYELLQDYISLLKDSREKGQFWFSFDAINNPVPLFVNVSHNTKDNVQLINDILQFLYEEVTAKYQNHIIIMDHDNYKKLTLPLHNGHMYSFNDNYTDIN